MKHRHGRIAASGTLLAAMFLVPAMVGTPGLQAQQDQAASPSEPGDRASFGAQEILGLSPEMTRFLDRHIGRNLGRQETFLALMSAVFGKNGLDISYGNIRTKTARETFETRSGNCLSFTFLFVALARAEGLPAYFQEVGEVVSWDRRGEINLINRHMFAQVQIANADLNVDFLPGAEKRYLRVRRINDARALAHFFSNLGAEELTEGDAEKAAVYFRRALEEDEDFAPAWTNLGVALRRLGRLPEAEEAHQRALSINPGEHSAITNLASLYLAMGRQEQADELVGQVSAYRARNPFHHFRLGAHARKVEDFEAAARHFRNAIRRQPEESAFHEALGEALAELGDPAKARTSLVRALRLTEDETGRARLEARLRSLVSAATDNRSP